MRISDVKIRKLSGILETDGPHFRERLVQPVDIYHEYRNRPWGDEFGQQLDEKHFKVQLSYLQIETDDGVKGIYGPTWPSSNKIILQDLKPILLGKDPLATEMLWDQMHRINVHGRQGITMMGISIVDNALWDLKGKVLGMPVYKLIGGPTREQIPAYASMLGFPVLDLGEVRANAKIYQERGFKAQKWFFRHGPMSGPEGMKHNIALVKTLRETLGDDIDIMLDCWQSWDTNYTLRIAEQIAEYHPRWLEECVMPDRISSYKKIKEKINFPISGAEHEYTRWGFKRFIDAEALDILQPDLDWAGGLSEVMKIAACASTADLIIIPHQGVNPAGIAFSFAQSPIHTPYIEMLIKHSELLYFFCKEYINEDKGMIHPFKKSGMGIELDTDKIEEEDVMI